MERKILKSFIDNGFGFPVKLKNVPMVKVRGRWTPEIDYNKLTEHVLKALAHKEGRLSGAEVKFIRQHFEMTLQAFAKRFGVSHVAVIKWEKTGSKTSPMVWSTEKDIRLFLAAKLSTKPIEFASFYKELEDIPELKTQTLNLDVEDMAA